tara:strand:+ start:713 stop:850 length:138 start_codon:yes stop_codon:yes gene_type:complete
MVGAAGFEPAVTGSKPDALPLGYAPAFYQAVFLKAFFSRLSRYHL